MQPSDSLASGLHGRLAFWRVPRLRSLWRTRLMGGARVCARRIRRVLTHTMLSCGLASFCLASSLVCARARLHCDLARRASLPREACQLCVLTGHSCRHVARASSAHCDHHPSYSRFSRWPLARSAPRGARPRDLSKLLGLLASGRGTMVPIVLRGGRSGDPRMPASAACVGGTSVGGHIHVM